MNQDEREILMQKFADANRRLLIATSPMTPKGQIIYGICIGLLTVVIRNWGAYPEGMSFAILIMNSVVPLLNMWFKQKKFGRK